MNLSFNELVLKMDPMLMLITAPKSRARKGRGGEERAGEGGVC